MLTSRDLERFFSKVDKVPTGCWNFKGAKRGDYGAFHFGGRTWSSHRLSYTHHKGDIPKDLKVLHSCDNPICVNPEHLFLGSDQDNANDKVSKNRQYQGQNHWTSKASNEQIKEIRELWATGNYLQKELASKFGLARRTVSGIVNLKTRREVE